MAFGYGGRAYDDDGDNCWWREDNQTNHTQRTPVNHQPTTSFHDSAYDDFHGTMAYSHAAAHESKTENLSTYKANKASQSFVTKSISSKKKINNMYSNSRQKNKPSNTPQSISNPAYRNQIRNKCRNPATKRVSGSIARQRPQIHTIEQQQAYKEQLRNQTNSHLDESLRTVYQSEELAADSSQRLYHQRKQLENVDKMLHETDQDLDRTEHTLKGMKSLWGGITNYFRKAPERKPYQKRNSNVNRKKERSVQLQKKNIHQDNDDEFNEKLDELHKSVKRLRVMTENMNQELDDQGELLLNIDDKMSNVDQRIHKQTYTMNRIR